MLCIAIRASDRGSLVKLYENLRIFVPHARYVVYNDGYNAQLTGGIGVQLCPTSIPLRPGQKARWIYDVMRWWVDTYSDDLGIITIDTEAQFIRTGFEDWAKSLFGTTGIFGINLNHFRADDTSINWIPAQEIISEWDIWRPLFRSNEFWGALHCFQGYRRDTVRTMMKADWERYLSAMKHSNVFALEEILYPTVAMETNLPFHQIPESDTRFVRPGCPLNPCETALALKFPDILFAYPVHHAVLSSIPDVCRPPKENVSGLSPNFYSALSSAALMERVIDALDNKLPLSVISVGATETFVMAQYALYDESKFMNHPEVWVANEGYRSGFGHRGVRFPSAELRDKVVEAVRRADIVGYNLFVYDEDSGWTTERVFEIYGIRPKDIFDSYLRRVVQFSQDEKFRRMLKGRRVVLVGEPAGRAKQALEERRHIDVDCYIVGTISIDGYESLQAAKSALDGLDFDLCLLAAGTNAILLADYVRFERKKVAFDIGSGINSLVTGEVHSDQWLERFIGYDRLMQA